MKDILTAVNQKIENKLDEVKASIYSQISNALIDYYEEGKNVQQFIDSIGMINKSIEGEHDRHWDRIYTLLSSK